MTGADALVLFAAAAGKPFAASLARLPQQFNGDRARDLEIRVNLVTSGPEPGNWLLSVAQRSCRIESGSVPRPDAWLFTDSDVGQRIMGGRLRLEDAVTHRLLDYEGDESRLARLRACFDFGRGA